MLGGSFKKQDTVSWTLWRMEETRKKETRNQQSSRDYWNFDFCKWWILGRCRVESIPKGFKRNWDALVQ